MANRHICIDRKLYPEVYTLVKTASISHTRAEKEREKERERGALIVRFG